jgi:hypothetical protein
VWFGLVDFIVLPTQTLSDAQASPFFFPEQLQSAFGGVEIVAGNGFQHGFGELDVSILVLVVVVPRRASACEFS